MPDIVVPTSGASLPLPEAATELVRLQAAVEERDDVLALAAHELRNPLHAMSLQLALARSTALQGGQQDVADRIRRAEATLRRYSERVTVLMELLAAPSASYPLTRREVDLSQLGRALVDALEHDARQRGIVLQLDAPAQVVRHVDPVVVEQVVDNLVLNALKHSGARTVTLRLRSSADHWSFAVADDGHGIAPDDQESIFRKFTVAQHSPRGNGTGLGLWIVSRLVSAMHGRVLLDSAPGAGCTFTIHVPTLPA